MRSRRAAGGCKSRKLGEIEYPFTFAVGEGKRGNQSRTSEDLLLVLRKAVEGYQDLVAFSVVAKRKVKERDRSSTDADRAWEAGKMKEYGRDRKVGQRRSKQRRNTRTVLTSSCCMGWEDNRCLGHLE